MSFTPKQWKDWPDTSTPRNAAAYIDLEERLAAYAETQPGPAGPPGADGAPGAPGGVFINVDGGTSTSITFNGGIDGGIG